MLNVTATAKRRGDNPNAIDFPAGSSHWTVTLRFYGHRMSVPFSMGPAHTEPPSARAVMACLTADAAGFDNARDFADWCAEYGYDTDSRKAERIYRTVERQAKRLRAFLGESYGQALALDWDA